MDWPEPPNWLVVLGSLVIAPIWAMFLFLWMLSEMVSSLIRLIRGPGRDSW
jgi:hypothetical protein